MPTTENNVIGIKVPDMLEKEQLDEADLFIVTDTENTKKVTLINFIRSIVKDNEVPTGYRIYSALKIQQMIDEIKEQVTDDIGHMNGDVEELKKNMATVQQLEELRDELIKQIDDKISSDDFTTALEGYRRKEDKLTYKDFDDSSDENKLKLKNLAQEVIDAMTGNTTVIPTNRAPIGGWLTEDFADESITFKKLAVSYRFGGNIIEGNINEITKDGIYLLGSEVLNLPKWEGETEPSSRILKVTNIDNKIVMQEVYYCDDMEDRPVYKRKGSITRLHVLPFIETHDVNGTYKVDRNMLTEDFQNCGVVSTGSVFQLRNEGNYYVENTVTDLPTTGEDYMVKVSKYNDRYIFDAQCMTTNTCRLYTAMLYFTAGLMPVFTTWTEVSSTAKSKFDGKKVYFLGDGTLFGIGSDDIPNKSIGGIFTNKYGMHINNRAIADATFGSYSNEIFAEASVIEQIATTPLDDAEYIIIMAGTHDWASGMAQFGEDDSMTESSIKGSINLCIKNIMMQNTKAKLLFCTPIFRSRIEYGDGRDSDHNTVNDKWLSEFADAIIQVCQANHVPVVDLYRTSMINQYNAPTYLKDGLYPNDTGYALLAEKIYDAMCMYY